MQHTCDEDTERLHLYHLLELDTEREHIQQRGCDAYPRARDAVCQRERRGWRCLRAQAAPAEAAALWGESAAANGLQTLVVLCVCTCRENWLKDRPS